MVKRAVTILLLTNIGLVSAFAVPQLSQYIPISKSIIADCLRTYDKNIQEDDKIAVLELTNKVRDQYHDFDCALESYAILEQFKETRTNAKLGITEIFFYQDTSQKAWPYVIEMMKYEKDPTLLSNVYVAQGRIYLADENYARAEESFQTALKLDPDNEFAMIAYGVLKYKTGDISTAIEYFKQARADWQNIVIGLNSGLDML